MRQPVKCIVFDLGGVLVRVDYMKFCRAVARHAGLSAEEIYARIVETGLGRDFDQGLLTSDEFARRVREETAAPLDDTALRRLWNDVFERDREMEELLGALAAVLPVVMLSNVNVWHFEHLEESLTFFGLFDGMVLSFREGVLKPDPLLYKKAARAGGFEPARCLYIDDVREYAEGAAGQGMRSIHFGGRGPLEEALQDLGVSW